jgi:transcriptional regulator with XRE-family HTH domain
MNRYQFNYKKLYTELDKGRKEKKLSWTALGRELGVAPSTLKRTAIGKPMEADGIRAMVAWLHSAPEDFVYSTDNSIIPKAMKRAPKSNDKVSRFDKIALFNFLNDKRQTNYLSWREVAEKIGNVSVPMLKNLYKGGRISIDLAISIAGWLGQSIESFTYDSKK